jgi:hypothetical protein
MNDSEQLAQTIVEKIIALLEQRAGTAAAERERERLRERDTDVGRLPQTARAYIDARPTRDRQASALATATMVHRNRVLDGAGVTPEARRRAGPQRDGESDADYVARARRIQEEVRMRNLKGGVRAYAGAQRGDESDEDYLARGRAARSRRPWSMTVPDPDRAGRMMTRMSPGGDAAPLAVDSERRSPAPFFQRDAGAVPSADPRAQVEELLAGIEERFLRPAQPRLPGTTARVRVDPGPYRVARVGMEPELRAQLDKLRRLSEEDSRLAMRLARL